MNATTQQILNTAMMLSDDDRAALVEALIATLQPADQIPLDDSWRGIVQRRSGELRDGKVSPVPWSEVKQRAWEKLGG